MGSPLFLSVDKFISSGIVLDDMVRFEHYSDHLIKIEVEKLIKVKSPGPRTLGIRSRDVIKYPQAAKIATRKKWLNGYMSWIKKRYANGFTLTLQPDRLNEPKETKTPTRIFVNSMSDLFHEDIPLEYIKSVFKVMNDCPQHQFQVLTKRSEILLEYSPQLTWSDNIWAGVTVENDKVLDRIDDLKQVHAKVKWLSLEPLLGPLPNLDLDGIDWVVVGGEHATNFRPMEIDWVRDIRDQCIAAGVAFFFKQYSGKRPKSLGDKLDGRQWHEYPY